MCKEGVLKFKPGDLVEWPCPYILPHGASVPAWRGIVVEVEEVERPHLRPSKTQLVLVRWFRGHIGLGGGPVGELIKLEVESD